MAKILIIDDDRQICVTLSEYLRRQGFEVFTATDGREGLKSVESLSPDLIICDLNMPDLSGQDVVSSLRGGQCADEEIPVIFLSGCSDRDQIRRSMNLGGDDFITKPAPLPEILEAVKSRLERSQKRKHQLEKQLQQAAEIFVGIIDDLKFDKASPEIRWLADLGSDAASRQNQILRKVRQSLKNPPPAEDASPKTAAPSVLVKKDSRQHFLKLSEVKALMACGEYSDIYWAKDQHMMFRKPLKQWEVELPSDQFVRVHRQTIINMAFLDFVEKDPEGKLRVHLQEFKYVIPVSQRETAEFNRRLKTYQSRAERSLSS